jgi:hypothetical protein
MLPVRISDQVEALGGVALQSACSVDPGWLGACDGA